MNDPRKTGRNLKGVLLVLTSVSVTLVTTEIALRAVEYWKSVPATISDNEPSLMTEARGTSWLSPNAGGIHKRPSNIDKISGMKTGYTAAPTASGFVETGTRSLRNPQSSRTQRSQEPAEDHLPCSDAFP